MRGTAPVSSIAFAIATSRATRFSTLGWVENKLSMRAPDNGLTMKRWAEAGLRSAVMLGIWCAAPAIFSKAEASDRGLPADLRALAVGLVFAGAADGHLHEACGERPEDHERERADEADLVVAVAASAEEEGEVREHGDGAGDGRRDRHEQRVVVLDVAELVREHAGKLFVRDACARARW